MYLQSSKFLFLKNSIASTKFSTQKIFISGIFETFVALSLHNKTFFINPCFAKERIIGNIELLSFISPFKDNSPNIWKSLKLIFSSYNDINKAIGKSKWVPLFLISLGARLIVIFLEEIYKNLLIMKI